MIYVRAAQPRPVQRVGMLGRVRRNKYHALPTMYHEGVLHSLCPEEVRHACYLCSLRYIDKAHWYDSKREAEYAAWLDTQFDAGDIEHWERGKRIVLLDAPKAKDRVTYKPDFYVVPIRPQPAFHVDVKSAPRIGRDGKKKGGITETRDFRIKVKLWQQNIRTELRVAYSPLDWHVVAEGAA